MTPKRKFRLRVIGISLLLVISMASFTYMRSVDPVWDIDDDPVLVEEREEEKSELLPDVQLIKALMQRTLDFMSVHRPM